MTEILQERSFQNAENIKARVDEMLKDGRLTREERSEILNVWHMFRKSKDGIIIETREKIRQFALEKKDGKDWYEWLARRLYTDSWTWSHNETPGYYEEVYKNMTVQIIETQSLNIDGVSGATVTSRAFINGVKSGLSQALDKE